jgi:ribosomal-protein-serine acetyltransferase
MPLRLTVSPEIELRLMRGEEDGHRVFQVIQRNRAFLREWLPWLDENRTPLDTRPHIDHWWRGYHQGLGFSLGIFYEEALAGTIGFHAFDERNRITSLGYWLGKEFNGLGIMTRSVERMAQYAFTERNMNRLYIRCAAGNLRSSRIPKRLGFVYEGTQRQAEWLYDHFVDLEVYSLLREEWMARHGKLLKDDTAV